MGVKDILKRKEGVIVGDDVLNLFKYAQEKNFAIPAIVSLLLAAQRTREFTQRFLERDLLLNSRCFT